MTRRRTCWPHAYAVDWVVQLFGAIRAVGLAGEGFEGFEVFGIGDLAYSAGAKAFEYHAGLDCHERCWDPVYLGIEPFFVGVRTGPGPLRPLLSVAAEGLDRVSAFPCALGGSG